MNKRSFATAPAVRQQVPLLVGLAGASGSGKTYSALRLATGMQQVTGGDIIFIDTENRRALHYADEFTFQHIDMQPPFGSLDYLQALEYAASLKPAAVIVDSMSHEHEGPGGLIDFQAREVERMSGGDWKKAEKIKMLAWQAPKQARRQLLNGIVRLNMNVIMCFRAGEKAKPDDKPNAQGKREMVQMGFTPIAAKEFVYEMTLCALFRPGARGRPTWESPLQGEHEAIKLPGQFQRLFADGVQMAPEHGRALAEWARGGSAPEKSATAGMSMDQLQAEGDAAAAVGTEALLTFWRSLSKDQQLALSAVKDLTWKDRAAKADSEVLRHREPEEEFPPVEFEEERA